MGNYCNKCIAWEKVAPNIVGSTFGICHNKHLALNMILDGRTEITEGGTIWTNSFFGCVYFRDRPDEIISFDDIIDSDTGKIK